METPVVTFLGYITYKYFLKTAVELKPRQCSLCGCWLETSSRLGSEAGKESCPPPCPAGVGGVPVATKTAAVKAQEPKSSAPPLPELSWSLDLPGSAVRLSVRGVCVVSLGLELLAAPPPWPGPVPGMQL